MSAPRKPADFTVTWTPSDQTREALARLVELIAPHVRGTLRVPARLPSPGATENMIQLRALPEPLQGALRMAERGFAVIRLRPGTKVPIIGAAEATKEASRISAWWQSEPYLNFGYLLGTEHVGIDCDVYKAGGTTDRASLGEIPATFRAQSPRGGEHIVLRISRQIGQQKLAPTIDVRTGVGYLVCPGSIVDGKAYTVLEDAAPAACPPHIDVRLGRRLELPERTAAWVDGTCGDWRAKIDEQLWARIRQEGTDRSKHCFQVLKDMFSRGLTDDDVVELLAEETDAAFAAKYDGRGDLEAEISRVRREWNVDQENKLKVFSEVKPFSANAPDMNVLRLRRSDPPALPLEAFGALAPWIREQAKAKSAPVDYVAAGLLAALTAMIGSTRRVNVEGSWSEPAIMWLAVVGAPSTNKSPALDAAFTPLHQIEQRMATEYGELLRAYEANKLAAVERREVWEAEVKAATEAKAPLPPIPVDAQTPLKPTRPRVRINNATTQKLMEELARHDRGFLLFRDELAGWLGDFDRFGGNGGDRAQYIEMFGGRSSSIDRVKLEDTLRIKFMHVSVVGGIQPDRLDSLLLNTDDDGLTARFLFLWPSPAPLERYTATPDDRIVERAFERLRTLMWDASGAPVSLSFSKEAADAMWDWRKAHSEACRDLTGFHASSMGKMPGYVARLALVLEHAQWAVSNEAFPPTTVSAGAVRSAVALTDAYFKPMQVRVLGEAALGQAERGAAVLAREIVSRRVDELNVRQVKREWRLPGLQEGTVDAAVLELVEAGWLKGDEGPRKPGRPGKTYMVDPRVHELATSA